MRFEGMEDYLDETKPTDNELINIFERCTKTLMCNFDREECPYAIYVDCHDRMEKNALDLIKRQQAEIERLKDENKKCLLIISSDTRRLKDEYERLKKAKTAAIEKFETKLKERQFSFIDDGWVERYVPVQAIDDVKKELLGDTDA